MVTDYLLSYLRSSNLRGKPSNFRRTFIYRVHTRYWYIPGAAASVGSIRAGEAYGQAERQSMKKKKPIEVLVRSRPALKAFRVAELITCWSRLFDNLFIKAVTPQVQSTIFSIFAEWPLVATPVFSLNMLSKRIFDHPLYILKTSRRPALFHFFSKDRHISIFIRDYSCYHSKHFTGIGIRLLTLSRWFEINSKHNIPRSFSSFTASSFWLPFPM